MEKVVNKGPIILIDDDEEDKELFKEVLKALEVTHELLWCENGSEAWDLLSSLETPPFLILSDINMPKINGMELLKKIHENEEMRKKSIPFVFFSTTAKKKEVEAAYLMTVQGFFIKESNFEALKKSVRILVDYWTACIHPTSLT